MDRIERRWCPRCGQYMVDIAHEKPRFAWDWKWMEWDCPRCGECEELESRDD